MARLLREAKGVVDVRDNQGNLVGRAHPLIETEIESSFTDEEITEASKRANSKGPWYTTKEVLAHLRSLAPETDLPPKE